MTTTRKSNFAAGLRTTLLMATLAGLLVGIGAIVGGPDMAALFLGIALVINLGSWFFSDKIAIKMSGAKPVTEEQAPGLYQMVRELCTRADLPMPSPLRDPAGAAERVRDRPQPEERGGRGDRRDHEAPLRGRASRRDRP